MSFETGSVAPVASLRPAELQVEALAGVPVKALDVLRRMHAAVTAAVTSPRMVSPRDAGGMKRETDALVAKARDTAAGEIDALRESAQGFRAAAERIASRRVDGEVPSDAAERAAREQELQAVWGRVRPVLDRLDGSVAVSRAAEITGDAVKEGDLVTPVAVRRELPLYLEARGDVDLVEVAAVRVAAAMSDARPEFAAVFALLADVERGWPRIDVALSQAAKIARGGDPSFRVLPGWAEDGSGDLLIDFPPQSIGGVAGRPVTLTA